MMKWNDTNNWSRIPTNGTPERETPVSPVKSFCYFRQVISIFMQRHADKDQQREEEGVLYPPNEFHWYLTAYCTWLLWHKSSAVSEFLIQLYFLSKQGAKYILQGVERVLQSFNITHTSSDKRLN